MWDLKTIKEPKGQQELKVSMELKQMVQCTYATNSYEFESAFKELLSRQKRTNNFSAELMFRVKNLDIQTVEIWKMTADGDFKHKIFELKYNEKLN